MISLMFPMPDSVRELAAGTEALTLLGIILLGAAAAFLVFCICYGRLVRSIEEEVERGELRASANREVL